MRDSHIKDSLTKLTNCNLPFTHIFDVGVQHSTPVLMSVFPDLPHHLFEPVEEYYATIKSNYEAFNFSLVEAAVSDVDGELNLRTERKTRGEEISHSYLVDSTSESSRKVNSVKLDSYFDAIQPGNGILLKIDVEGPTVPTKILKGAENTLAHTTAVIIEMTVDTFMDRAIVLHQAGFDLWDLCDLCYYDDCLWQVDAVFIKRSLKKENLQLTPIHALPFDPQLWQSGFWNHNLQTT